MRFTLRSILLLALTLPNLAIASETLLGAPSYNNRTECTYRQVTWEDFRGDGKKPSGWGRWQNGTFAHIATGIQLGRFEIATRESEGEWIAVAVGIRPYAVMAKDFSAVMHGSRNAYSLAHEQLHFDIAEVAARRLAVELASLEGRSTSSKQAREDLSQRLGKAFEAGVQGLHELQDRYDGETAHSTKKKKQKKWAEDVAQMFRQATEALEAQLATGS